MRAVVQRVKRAEVRVGSEVVGRIGRGLVAVVGIASDDTPEAGKLLAQKIVDLRIFDDEQGRMNRSLLETEGALLCVSQFTLLGDCRKGRRPSFDRAASPDRARPLYEAFLDDLRQSGVAVEAGRLLDPREAEVGNHGPATPALDLETVLCR